MMYLLRRSVKLLLLALVAIAGLSVAFRLSRPYFSAIPTPGIPTGPYFWSDWTLSAYLLAAGLICLLVCIVWVGPSKGRQVVFRIGLLLLLMAALLATDQQRQILGFSISDCYKLDPLCSVSIPDLTDPLGWLSDNWWLAAVIAAAILLAMPDLRKKLAPALVWVLVLVVAFIAVPKVLPDIAFWEKVPNHRVDLRVASPIIVRDMRPTDMIEIIVTDPSTPGCFYAYYEPTDAWFNTYWVGLPIMPDVYRVDYPYRDKSVAHLSIEESFQDEMRNRGIPSLEMEVTRHTC